MFSVSYSVLKRKKKYKNNEVRSQAKGEASTLKTGKLHYQPVKVRLADLEGGVHETFSLFLLTTQMHFAIISGQH